MQDTPKANRLHIAIFGRRNVGKSSLINALTNQDIALVSEVPGTTTDPVFKAMEIPPIGPVVLIDTAGIDDEGKLGRLRIKKTRAVLSQTDLALLVLDAKQGISDFEQTLKKEIETHNIPIIGILNKSDLGISGQYDLEKGLGLSLLPVSSTKQEGIEELKLKIIEKAPADAEIPVIAGDLVPPGGLCILVVPIDSSAPKGRLILPQVQTIRDLLDADSISLVVKETGLASALGRLTRPPDLVVTDSQAFSSVSQMVPDNVSLTSFSILFARYKGDLKELVKGVQAIKGLHPGDRVLIAEACTHHRQEEDIGRVKIPHLLDRFCGGSLEYTWSSGLGYPDNLKDFSLIVHCGACMINRRQMLYRIREAQINGIPIVNYGVLLAFLNGILDRALQPFSLNQDKN